MFFLKAFSARPAIQLEMLRVLQVNPAVQQSGRNFLSRAPHTWPREDKLGKLGGFHYKAAKSAFGILRSFFWRRRSLVAQDFILIMAHDSNLTVFGFAPSGAKIGPSGTAPFRFVPLARPFPPGAAGGAPATGSCPRKIAFPVCGSPAEVPAPLLHRIFTIFGVQSFSTPFARSPEVEIALLIIR